MHITVLHGSPKEKGNTNTVAEVVLSALREAGHGIEPFDTYRMDIRPCLACIHCQQDWEHPNCIQEDDMTQIFTSVMKSDLLMIVTPIYSWYCTPPVKSILDRMVYAFNKYYGKEKGPSIWEGKKVALITTCGYRPEKGADLFEEGIKRYCKHSRLTYLGMLCERHPENKDELLNADARNRIDAFVQMLNSESCVDG